jgi:hypothetical protein
MKRKLSLKTRKKSNRRLPKKTYDLYNGDKWDNYRLGDVIYGHFICWNKVCLNKTIKDKELLTTLCNGLEHDLENDTEKDNVLWCKHNTDNWADPKNLKIGYLDSIHKNYPNSIADKYVKQVGYPNNFRVSDFDVLKSIFKKLNYKKPKSDTLVIHLRLGDVLSKKYINEYVYNLSYYKDLLKRIKKNKNIKGVDIVTGLHKNMFVKKSNVYLNNIINIFKDDYKVSVILTKNPDKDLYYMCHSKFFANSGGGFSRLVLNYLKGLGNVKIYSDETI